VTPIFAVLNEKLARIQYMEEDSGKRNSGTTECLDHICSENAAFRMEKGKVLLQKDGVELLCVERAEFTSYDIVRTVGGNNEVRSTADGIKESRIGGTTEFVRPSVHAKLVLTFGDDVFWGLGNHEEGYPTLNGHWFPMLQENRRIAVPFFVSNKGYAVMIPNMSYQSFDFREPGICKIYVDCAEQLEIVLLAGTIDEIYANLRELTGVTPMLPKWALGYIQSKEHYHTQEQLIEVVREYRRRGVPLDCVVQDWFYWRDGKWGDKNPDPTRYPDVSGVISEIHENHAKLMVSIWPNMSGDGENQQEFREAGLLLADGSVYDAFSEEGRTLYWKQVKEGWFRHGVDAWWCDSSEPYDACWEGEVRPSMEEEVEKTLAECKKNMDDAKTCGFSLYHAQGIYENQRKESNKRVINLTRSATLGQHRYGTVVWSGDISASWETLRKQVHILQNYIATGEAYWNSDIGAFFVRKNRPWFWDGHYELGCEDEAYRELYVRWLQFAAFTPMMRSHGTDTPREIWNFGAPGERYYEAIRRSIELRYRLLPFFYSVHAQITLFGKMPVLPVGLRYPAGTVGSTASDQYLYGENLLVCPVLEMGATERRVYLPEGTWYDYDTEQRYEGGCEIRIPVTLDHIPVFVKAGSILPELPVQQYVSEKPEAKLTLRVFSGANGTFSLYNDAGDGYEYEHGAYSLREIRYDDASGTITITEQGEAAFAREIATVRLVGK